MPWSFGHERGTAVKFTEGGMRMLHSVEGFLDFPVCARDGELGRIKDVYFDDKEWTIRHLVVNTGGWLIGRKVLIAPNAMETVDWGKQKLWVRLTRQQVQNSPDIDTDVPVSRQHEKALCDYYGYPYYWNGPYLWGYTVVPGIAAAGIEEQPSLEDAQQQALRERMERERANADSHLRSGTELIGYDMQTADDTFGHVEDMLFDDETWRIELLAVDMSNRWPGKKALISTERIERVNRYGKNVVVNVTREQIEHSPEYDPDKPPARDGTDDVYRRIV